MEFGDYLVSSVLVLIIAAFDDQSNSRMPTVADGDGEFADFSSFRDTSLSTYTSQSAAESHFAAKTEANCDMSSLSGYQPAFSLSLSVPDNCSSVVSGKGASDKYQMIKQLISDPSLFASAPSLASGLTENGNGEWSDYHGLSSTNVIHSGVQNSSDADFCQSSPDDGEWADFQSTSAVGISNSAGQAVHMSLDNVQPSLPDFDSKEPSSKTKSSATANNSNAVGWFGIRQNYTAHCKPAHALFSSGALDFSPPELLPDNDDDDAGDLGFYSVSAGCGGQGISSLSTVYLEEEPDDAVRNGGSFLKPGVHGMTTSNSTSSFEFTGWQHDSKHTLPVPGADTQSTSSLDLRPATDALKRSQANAEADSQSENSLEFVPPSETRMPPSGVLGADFDRMSLQSLELKSTIVSPEEEPSYRITQDDVVPVTCQSLGGIDDEPINSGMPTSHRGLISLQLYSLFNFISGIVCVLNCL